MAGDLADRIESARLRHDAGVDVFAEAEALFAACKALPRADSRHEPADRLRATVLANALRIGPLEPFAQAELEALRPGLEGALLAPSTQAGIREHVRARVAAATDAASTRDRLMAEVEAADQRVRLLRAMLDTLDALVGGVA